MNYVIIDMSAGKTDDNSKAKGGSGMRLDWIAAITGVITVAISLGEFILHLIEHREEHHDSKPKHRR